MINSLVLYCVVGKICFFSKFLLFQLEFVSFNAYFLIICPLVLSNNKASIFTRLLVLFITLLLCCLSKAFSHLLLLGSSSHTISLGETCWKHFKTFSQICINTWKMINVVRAGLVILRFWFFAPKQRLVFHLYIAATSFEFWVRNKSTQWIRWKLCWRGLKVTIKTP